MRIAKKTYFKNERLMLGYGKKPYLKSGRLILGKGKT